ncbi:hypothetical protein Q8F55_002386 [Vanrija albida]|uniref:Uncharacterized protein n=1 Tax=Vanrija albida TaxID=181172 RepID=A0ABR3Q9M0_9TREE
MSDNFIGMGQDSFLDGMSVVSDPTGEGSADETAERFIPWALEEAIERILRERPFTIKSLLEEVVAVSLAAQKARLSFEIQYTKKGKQKRPKFSSEEAGLLSSGGRLHKAFSGCGVLPEYLLATSAEYNGDVQRPKEVCLSMAMIAAFTWLGHQYARELARSAALSAPVRVILPVGILRGDREAPIDSRVFVPLYMEPTVVGKFAEKLAGLSVEQTEGLTDRQKLELINPVRVRIDAVSSTKVEVWATLPVGTDDCRFMQLLEQVRWREKDLADKLVNRTNKACSEVGPGLATHMGASKSMWSSVCPISSSTGVDTSEAHQASPKAVDVYKKSQS